MGTVSPWSSKATDIAHVCGLASIRRLERGTLYFIAATEDLRPAELRSLGLLLHDRMTESVWIGAVVGGPIEPEGLFHSAAARPLRIVELGTDGHAALARANAEWGLALSDDEIDYLVTAFGKLRTRPHRCRTDDVRASQLRALPPQDLQRGLRHRRRAACLCRCSP